MGCSDVNTTHTDIFIITLAPGTLPSPRHNYINNTVGTSHTSHMAIYYIVYILPFSYVEAGGERIVGEILPFIWTFCSISRQTVHQASNAK